jgi:hypothetical protein
MDFLTLSVPKNFYSPGSLFCSREAWRIAALAWGAKVGACRG